MLSGAWITIKFDRGHAKSVTHLGLKGVEQKDDKAWQGGRAAKLIFVIKKSS